MNHRGCVTRRAARGGGGGWKSLFLLFLALLLSLFPVHGAANKQLQFDVFLGYDGFLGENRWFPIVVEIDWTGEPFKGWVEVIPGQYNQDQVVREQVEVTNIRKRMVIPAFSSAKWGTRWTVQLVDARGRILEKKENITPKRQVGYDAMIIGGMPQEHRGLPDMPPAKNRQLEVLPAVARILPDLFPQNPISLEGMNAFYLHSGQAINLKVPQIEALQAWLRAGGHLVVAVNQPSDIEANPWLKAMMPMECSQLQKTKPGAEFQGWLNRPSDNVYPAGMRNFVGAQPNMQNPYPSIPISREVIDADVSVVTGKLRDGKVEVKSGDIPLIVSASRGRGKITVLTFNPEIEPFESYKPMHWFWAKIFDVPWGIFEAQYFQTQQSLSIDGVFAAMIESKQLHKLPIKWLLALLGCYLIVIGPLDHYWLKKIKKQMWTWVTFPLYVVIFSGLIYFIGFMLRAGEREWNELHIVDAFPNGNQAELHGYTYSTIYSPVTQRYHVRADAKFGMIRTEYKGISGTTGSGSQARVEQKGNTFDSEVSVPVWISQMFPGEWWTEAESLPVRVTVIKNGGSEQLKVDNLLDMTLAPVMVVHRQLIYDVGSISANQSKTIPLSGGRSLQEFYSMHANEFQAASEERKRAFGGGQAGRNMDVARGTMAASFSNSTGYNQWIQVAGLELNPIVKRGDTILLAWIPKFSFIKPMNQFQALRGERNTLLRISQPAPPL